jgi:modulator of FtsH protease
MTPLPGEWKDFFVTAAGAAAALSGLLFVALSINLSKILSVHGLPARAGETLIVLSGGMLLSLLCLVPGQSLVLSGSEIFLLALVIWGFVTFHHLRGFKRRYYLSSGHAAFVIGLSQSALIPLMVSGALLIAHCQYALYWLALGILLSFVDALVNAWVLLVEILR